MKQDRDTAPPDQKTTVTPHVTPVEDSETARRAAIRIMDPALADTLILRAIDKPTTRANTATPTPRRNLSRFVWLRHPEFWLAVALAAFLRLWHIDLAMFLDDQGQLLSMARDAWVHGALPVTGIPSSIRTLNPPLSIYALMPFTAFGKGALSASIAIALWSVLAVALCYIFTLRYFGRIIAASATLLFASSGMATYYSRFIWQQNGLPTVMALWILTLYLGCVSGRRGWFVPHVALLGVAILLHPSAGMLIPVSLLGFALTPRHALPSRWDWTIAGALVVLLLAPTVLWEVVGKGIDIRLLGHYLKGGGTFNLDVFRALADALGAPAPGDLGQHALYAQAGSWYIVVKAAAILCFAGGLIVLTERLARVSLYIWREGAASSSGSSGSSRMRGGLRAIWLGLRAEPAWRAHLLLWLSVAAPMVLLLRHGSPLYPHYLLVLYPIVFIVSGFTVQAIWRWASNLAPGRKLIRHAGPALILALLIAIVLGQTALSALYPATLASGSFDAFANYGYPLAEIQQLNTALGTLQKDQHARTLFISLSQSYRLQPALDYLTVSEHPDRIGFYPDCLVLPAPDEQPALVVATQPAGLANTMLASLPELQPVANLAMVGSESISVYQMNMPLPPLLGEHTLPPSTFADSAGNGLQLDALAVQPDGLIRLRWTVLSAPGTSQGTPSYVIQPAMRSANGSTRSLPVTECHLTRWHAGETVFTWVDPGTTADARTLLLQVHENIHSEFRHAGPFLLLTGLDVSAPPALLRPSAGTVSSDGALTLPLDSTL